jgi:integrase
VPRARRPYRAQPRHPITGKKFRVSAKTERELQAILNAVDSMRTALRFGMQSEAEIDRALRRLVHGSATLARAAAAYVEQTHLAASTRAGIASFVRGPGAPLAHVEIAELSAPRIESWLVKLQSQGASPDTREQYWRRLRSLVRFAASREWIGRLPWEGWRPIFRFKRRVREREAARSLGELARLFEAARLEDDERAARGLLPDVEAKIVAAAALGLRQGELAGLRWTDLDDAAQTITIARQWDGERPPKGGRARTLAASGALFALLARYQALLDQAELFAPSGPVFPDATTSAPGAPRAYAKGEVLTRRILRAVVQRAQLPNENRWSAHSLRDTFATLEERAHADLPTLALRTGHASLASLLRYLRASQRSLPPPGIVLPPAAAPPARLASRAVDKK